MIQFLDHSTSDEERQAGISGDSNHLLKLAGAIFDKFFSKQGKNSRCIQPNLTARKHFSHCTLYVGSLAEECHNGVCICEVMKIQRDCLCCARENFPNERFQPRRVSFGIALLGWLRSQIREYNIREMICSKGSKMSKENRRSKGFSSIVEATFEYAPDTGHG